MQPEFQDYDPIRAAAMQLQRGYTIADGADKVMAGQSETTPSMPQNTNPNAEAFTGESTGKPVNYGPSTHVLGWMSMLPQRAKEAWRSAGMHVEQGAEAMIKGALAPQEAGTQAEAGFIQQQRQQGAEQQKNLQEAFADPMHPDIEKGIKAFMPAVVGATGEGGFDDEGPAAQRATGSGPIKPEVVGEKAGEEARSVQEEEALREQAQSAWAQAGGNEENFLRDMYMHAHMSENEELISHLEGKMSPEEVDAMRAYTGRPPVDPAERMRAAAGMAEPGPEPKGAAEGGAGGGEPPPKGGKAAAEGGAEKPKGTEMPSVGDTVADHLEKLRNLTDPETRNAYTQKFKGQTDAFMEGGRLARDPVFQDAMHSVNEGTVGQAANAEEQAASLHVIADDSITHVGLAQKYSEAYFKYGEHSPEAQDALARLAIHASSMQATAGLRAQGFQSEAGRSLGVLSEPGIGNLRHYVDNYATEANNFAETGDGITYALNVAAAGPQGVAYAHGVTGKGSTELTGQRFDSLNYWLNRSLLMGTAGPVRKVISANGWMLADIMATQLAEAHSNVLGGGEIPWGTAKDMANDWVQGAMDRIHNGLLTITGSPQGQKNTAAHINDSLMTLGERNAKERMGNDAQMWMTDTHFHHEDFSRELFPPTDDQSLLHRGINALSNPDTHAWQAVADFDKHGAGDIARARAVRIEARRNVIAAGKAGASPEQMAKLEREQRATLTANPNKDIVNATAHGMDQGSFRSLPAGMAKKLYDVLNAPVGPMGRWSGPWLKFLLQMPFVRAQMNIAMRAEDFDPFAWMWRGGDPDMPVGAMRDTSSLVRKYRSVIGAGLGAMMLHGFMAGRVTGPGPFGKKPNQYWQQAGNVPDSVSLPGGLALHYQYYQELVPWLVAPVVGADFAMRAHNQGNDWASSLATATGEMMEHFVENFPVLNQLFWLAGTINNMHERRTIVPLGESLLRMADPTILKQTGGDKVLYAKVRQWQDLCKATEDAFDTSYKTYNGYGEEAFTGRLFSNADWPGRFMNAANWALHDPIVRRPPKDPVYEEVSRLNTVYPSFNPPELLGRNGNHMFAGPQAPSEGGRIDPLKPPGVKLTPKQEDEYMQLVSNDKGEIARRVHSTMNLHQALTATINSRQYQNANDVQRMDQLKDTWADYIEGARDEFLSRHREVGQAIDQRQAAIDEFEEAPRKSPVSTSE